MSNVLKYVAPASNCKLSLTLGMAYAFFTVRWLSFLSSMQKWIEPSFFHAITTLELYGLYLSYVSYFISFFNLDLYVLEDDACIS